jgi:hypothetical protein
MLLDDPAQSVSKNMICTSVVMRGVVSADMANEE